MSMKKKILAWVLLTALFAANSGIIYAAEDQQFSNDVGLEETLTGNGEKSKEKPANETKQGEKEWEYYDKEERQNDKGLLENTDTDVENDTGTTPEKDLSSVIEVEGSNLLFSQRNTMLKNPEIIYNSDTEEETKATWDCVWFGSYPQAEVVSTEISKNYKKLEKRIAQGEIIVSDEIYSRLAEADEGKWNNNEITEGGERYRRILRENATYCSSDYSWYDSTTYHYFKYEPIKWRVLSINDSQALLLSDRTLDDQTYRIIPDWLNARDTFSEGNSFLCDAFTGSEQEAIRDDADTEDKIFLLSKADVRNTSYGFYGTGGNEGTYQSEESMYALAMGADTGWWTSTRYYSYQEEAYALVHYDNGGMLLIYPIDGYQGKNFYGVRPALNLDITSDQWSYAGTVCSDGTINEEKNDINDNQGENSESEHQSAYTAEHFEFINSAEYKERMDECWAGILSKGLDTATGKIGESLYKVLNSGSEILSGQCKSLSIFDNPYDAVITDLILAQMDLKESNIKLEYNNALLSGMSQLESICQKADSDWTLHASEYKTCLEKLIEDPKNYKDSNPVFYELCERILGGLAENDELNKLLNAFGKAGELQSALNTYANVVNWVADCLKYNALVQAYLRTSDEFKQSLKDAIVYMALNTSGDDFISRVEYGKMYEDAYEKFAAFQTTENISALLFKEYVSNGADQIENVFGGAIVKNAIFYVSEGLGISATAASWLFACIEAYKTGWSISEAITNNGTNIECRELIRAYYYLEDAFMWEVDTDSGNLKKEQSYACALKLDASYTILKNLECAVLDTYVKYLNNLQTSFAQGVLHGFSDYTEAEISVAKIWKLNWKNTKCHDRDENYKQYKTYSTINICCPTDVYVYDQAGDLVYCIENNVIAAKSDEIDGTVIGSMKFLLITDISKYVIHVVAADEGIMNYQVNTYDSATGTLIETANYLDVALEEGDDYTGTFQEEILLQKNGNEVEPDCRVTNTDEKILVTSVEIKEPVQEMKVNESAVLQTNVEPSNATFPVLNWTSTNEEVVKADETGFITAVGLGECDIQCSAIDGSGQYDTVTVKVAGREGVNSLGDLNGDGEIGMVDLLMCLHHVSGRTLLTGNAFLAADINGDGAVKMTDLMRILHYVSGRNTVL